MLGTLPTPRLATFGRWRDAAGEVIDSGIALYFPAPGSFTGEDVLELQGHAGLIVEALIERVVELGARRARPGEFSERAFLNDKIDLAQAEAIADLIDAGSRGAARAAMRSLQGEFSARVVATRAALTQLRIYVEAAIDFPEEEIDFLASRELRRARGIRAPASGRSARGRAPRGAAHARPDGGDRRPAQRRQEHADECAWPGTTSPSSRRCRAPRAIRCACRIDINGVPVELIDTAGLREPQGEGDHDAIEAEGMRRARDAIARADHVLYVVDAAADPDAYSFAEECDTLPEGLPVTLVMNKSDIAVGVEDADRVSAETYNMASPRIAISAATGAGHRCAASAHGRRRAHRSSRRLILGPRSAC